MKESKSSNDGIGFVGMLTVLFVGLKLCGVIDWAWAWVLSPIWITALLVLLVIAAYTLFFVCKHPGTPLFPKTQDALNKASKRKCS